MDYKNLEMLAWLVGQLRKAGETGITYDELIDRLVEEPGLDKFMQKRSFHNYVRELRDRFGIKIVCDRRRRDVSCSKLTSAENPRYRYRIADEPGSESQPWAMPFLIAFESSLAMKGVQDNEENRRYMYIDCKATGAGNVNVLIDAIRQQRCIDFVYYYSEKRFPYHEVSFEPRGLVMKNHVWFLLGHTNYRKETIWPLSVLTEIRITDVGCRPDPGFSPERFWKTHKNLWEEYFM